VFDIVCDVNSMVAEYVLATSHAKLMPLMKPSLSHCSLAEVSNDA
jgi:hypothetical protein